jgi:hypothetical protein
LSRTNCPHAVLVLDEFFLRDLEEVGRLHDLAAFEAGVDRVEIEVQLVRELDDGLFQALHGLVEMAALALLQRFLLGG